MNVRDKCSQCIYEFFCSHALHSLGHTGRLRHAEAITLMIYMLVNMGAMLRVFGPGTDLTTSLVLGLSAMIWSGGYLRFALVYGPYLFRPSLDED